MEYAMNAKTERPEKTGPAKSAKREKKKNYQKVTAVGGGPNRNSDRPAYLPMPIGRIRWPAGVMLKGLMDRGIVCRGWDAGAWVTISPMVRRTRASKKTLCALCGGSGAVVGGIPKSFVVHRDCETERITLGPLRQVFSAKGGTRNSKPILCDPCSSSFSLHLFFPLPPPISVL